MILSTLLLTVLSANVLLVIIAIMPRHLELISECHQFNPLTHNPQYCLPSAYTERSWFDIQGCHR
jgi:hypothetical protein